MENLTRQTHGVIYLRMSTELTGSGAITVCLGNSFAIIEPCVHSKIELEKKRVIFQSYLCSFTDCEILTQTRDSHVVTNEPLVPFSLERLRPPKCNPSLHHAQLFICHVIVYFQGTEVT